MGLVSGESRYLETNILTASPEELITKIFDGLIQFSRLAIEKMKSDPSDLQSIHDNLRKAQRACALLMGSLNFEAGGELANNLFRQYEFWHHELVMANMQQNYQRIESLVPDFIDYRKTWTRVIDQARAARAGSAFSTDSVRIG